MLVAAWETVWRWLPMLHHISPLSLYEVAACLHGATEIQHLGTAGHAGPLPIAAWRFSGAFLYSLNFASTLLLLLLFPMLRFSVAAAVNAI